MNGECAIWRQEEKIEGDEARNRESEPKAAPAAKRELVLTRLLDAPRAKLFRCWTEPAPRSVRIVVPSSTGRPNERRGSITTSPLAERPCAGKSTIFRVLEQRAERLGPELSELVQGAREGRLRLRGSVKDAWTAELARRLFGPSGPKVEGA